MAVFWQNFNDEKEFKKWIIQETGLQKQFLL
jgi:hypothetical protein